MPHVSMVILNPIELITKTNHHTHKTSQTPLNSPVPLPPPGNVRREHLLLEAGSREVGHMTARAAGQKPPKIRL